MSPVVTVFLFVAFVSPVAESRSVNTVVTGHFVLAAPSVYLMVKSSSKIPASGATSEIEPNCLVQLSDAPATTLQRGTPSLPTSMSPVVFAEEPPAYASTTRSAPLLIVILSGPTTSPAISEAMTSSPVAEMSKSGSLIRM